MTVILIRGLVFDLHMYLFGSEEEKVSDENDGKIKDPRIIDTILQLLVN